MKRAIVSPTDFKTGCVSIVGISRLNGVSTYNTENILTI